MAERLKHGAGVVDDEDRGVRIARGTSGAAAGYQPLTRGCTAGG